MLFDPKPSEVSIAVDTDGHLIWNCQACGKSIADNEGTLAVSQIEIREVEIWRWEHGGRPISLSEMPDDVRWTVLHHACDPNIEGAGQYHFNVQSIRTLGQVIHWTAHLLDKGWLHHTDWTTLLYRIEGVTE